MTRGLTRRHLMAAGAAATGAVAAGCSAPSNAADGCDPAMGQYLPTPSDAPSLRQLADAKGFQIGSVFATRLLDRDDPLYSPEYTALVKRECNIVTTENAFKSHRIIDLYEERGARPTLQFDATDNFVTVFQQADIAVRGTSIIYDRYTDAPFFNALSPREMREFHPWYVETMVARYAGRVASWDVVNEVAVPRGGGDGTYRDGAFFNALGRGYVAESFKRARAADPDAQLVLNDFAFAWAARWAGRQRASFLKILDDALEAGAPIDAVGIQSHLRTDDHLSQDAFMQVVEDIRARGVDIIITELDISEPADTRASIAERDAAMAVFLRRYLEPLMREKRIKTVVWWGLSDLRATQYHHAMAENPITEFRPRPLMYDVDYKPKPVRTVMAELIAAL